VTTARQKLPAERPEWQATAGQVFALTLPVAGRAEPRFPL